VLASVGAPYGGYGLRRGHRGAGAIAASATRARVVTAPSNRTPSRPRCRWARRLALATALGAGLLAAPQGASATVTTNTYTVGPINVAGYEVKQDILLGVPKPPAGAITNMSVDIVDGPGPDAQPVPIQRLMLHHIVFLNAGRKDHTCDSFLSFDNLSTFPGAERFYAAGEERAKMALPAGYGYKFGSAPWAITYMVMNHRPSNDQAWIQYKVTVDDSAAIEHAKPYWFDVQNCHADPVYTVPGTKAPGSTHNRFADYVIPESGRIVGAMGHVHGGARRLALTEPDCGNREIGDSEPTWGNPDHPFYNVRPILHEPGPINMTGFQTSSGIPVHAGERLRLNSLYDNSWPHVRVMGIMLVFLVPDSSVAGNCGPLPNDRVVLGSSVPGRSGPIPFRIPLTGLDANGNAITIKKPPGRTIRVPSGTNIKVDDRFFRRRNVRIRRGQKLDYVFKGRELHNLTLANGPVGIGSPNLDGDRVFTQKFGRRGTYRFFCGLHPVQMQQRVVVVRKHPKHRKHRHRSGNN
jgi:plastocyanin